MSEKLKEIELNFLNKYQVTGISTEKALQELNIDLSNSSKETGIPVGEISIAGVAGDDKAKTEEIEHQYEGIMNRTSNFQVLPSENSTGNNS